MLILAFDFGTRHIGVAVGQTITGTSSPLMVLDVAQEGKKMKLNEEPSVRAAIDFVIEKVLMQAFLSKYVQENIKEENLKLYLLKF